MSSHHNNIAKLHRYNATMAVRLRVWLVAALLLCIFIFSSSAAEAAADDNNNSVCTANDTREECSAPPEDNDSSSDDDEDDEIPASCVDENENCRTWSDAGECDANPDCECIYQSCTCTASLLPR